MKKTSVERIRSAALAVFLAAYPALSHAQTATWNGGGGNTDWNNALNWDIGAVPAEGTNAVIGTGGITVDYNAPMGATSFGSLLSSGILNINADGFVIGASGTGAGTFFTTGTRLFVNNGGVVNASAGGISLTTNAIGSVAVGGTLTVAGNLLVGVGGSSSAGGGGATLTNVGGSITAGAVTVNANTGNPQNGLFQILGGTNTFGAVTVGRSSAGSGGFNALGTEGLIISNGIVNMTSLDVGGSGGNSFLTTLIANGTVTNTGDTTIRQGSASRSSRFLQTGGLYVSSGATGLNMRGHTANNVITIYSVTGGTNLISGILLGTPGGTDTTGTARLTNAAKIYIGAGGITSVGTLNTKTLALNNNGVFGAQADWVGTEPMLLAGGSISAADLDGTPHSITLNGVLSGAGALTKTGNGILTLGGTNTYSGNTLINQGTLALGANASVAASPAIIVGSGATFDVSGVTGGFTHSASRTLGGSGTVNGDVAVAAAGIINPGSNALTGTLTFANSLIEAGGVFNHFDLSTNPTGPNNDLLVVSGTLNLSGVNTIEVAGGGSPGSVHRLIQYGTLTGNLSNFSVNPPIGTLSNNAVIKAIYLIVSSTNRTATNIVWVGNSIVNDWDSTRTNWSVNGVLDHFITDDAVRFDATGAANPLVNIVGNVQPTSVTVNAAGNYSFLGNGSITGTGGLVKTNSGTLTISATNSYTGVTVIGGGVIDISTLAIGGANSPIGASSSDPNNIVFAGGTLRYSGTNGSTDHGLTLATDGTVDVLSAATTLTLGGLVTGNGPLKKAGAGVLTLSLANTHTNGSVINAGALAFDNAAAAGTGGITNNGSTLRIDGALVLNNIVEFNGTCNIELSGLGGGNAALRGSWFGSGTVNINIPGTNTAQTFTIGGQGSGTGGMEAFSGTVNFGTNSGFLRLNNDNSTFNFGSSNAIFDLGTGTGAFNQRNGGTTSDLGALIGGPDTRLAGRGNTGSSGTTTYSIGGRNLSTVFAGTITNGSGTGATAITKVGTATLTLTGTNVHTGDTIVSQGTLEIDGDNGTSAVTSDGGTLSGNGIISGPVIITAGGTIAPGSSGIGQLTINNSLQLDSLVSTTVMQLNKAANTNDSIIGLTSVSYGGTLSVVNVGGTLAENDTFVLFNATPGTYSGAFDVLNLPALPAGLNWDTSNLTVDGSIKVVAGLKFTSIIRSGSNLIMSGSNGVSSGTYYILTTTNLSILRTNWAALSTNVFEVDGSFNVTNPIVPGEPRRFYLLQQAP